MLSPEYLRFALALCTLCFFCSPVHAQKPAALPLIPAPSVSAPAPAPLPLAPLKAPSAAKPEAAPPPAPVDENLFYDIEALAPKGQMKNKALPRKADPAKEPASAVIVVNKDQSGSSRSAQLVSAERALKLGRYESALEIYERIYAADSRNAEALLGRAISYQRLNRSDEALGAYEELLGVDPSNVEAQINMLGLMGRRYPAVSLQRLLDLRESYPSNAGIAAQIAVVQAALGDYEQALQYLGIAAGTEPQNPAHVYNMAVIADRTGQAKVAVQYYEKALEVDTVYGGGRSIPREAIFERLAHLR